MSPISKMNMLKRAYNNDASAANANLRRGRDLSQSINNHIELIETANTHLRKKSTHINNSTQRISKSSK